MGYFGSYISEHGAKMLPKYQYAGADDSLVLKYITNPIYNRIAKVLPRWLAPNLITLWGLSFTLVSHIIILYFSPDMETRLPQWVYVVQAFAVLAYQCLDALDGKQARATGTSSPLGLLFDHGCDAVNTTIIIMSQMTVLQLGSSWWGLMMWFISGAVFFAGTWEEYYTGILYLPIVNAPNEGVHAMAVVSILTGFVLPPNFWKTPMKLPEGVTAPQLLGGDTVVPNQIFVIAMTLFGIITMLGNIYNVIKAINKKAPKGGVLKAYLVALTRGIPPMLTMILFTLWVIKSPNSIYNLYPIASLWLLGLSSAKSVVGIMLAHLCDEEYHPLSRTSIACLTLLIHQNIMLYFFDVNQVSLQDEQIVLLELLVIVALSMSHKAVSLIQEVTKILGIRCFVIPYDKKKKQN